MGAQTGPPDGVDTVLVLSGRADEFARYMEEAYDVRPEPGTGTATVNGRRYVRIADPGRARGYDRSRTAVLLLYDWTALPWADDVLTRYHLRERQQR